jgi:hypothetical protein
MVKKVQWDFSLITVRLDEFTIPEVWGGTMIELGGEMKTRRRKV